MSGPCASCGHWTLEHVPAYIAAQGWGRCALNVTWQYQAGTAACMFKPSRFAERQVIEVVPANPVLADQRIPPAPCDLPEELDFG